MRAHSASQCPGRGGHLVVGGPLGVEVEAEPVGDDALEADRVGGPCGEGLAEPLGQLGRGHTAAGHVLQHGLQPYDLVDGASGGPRPSRRCRGSPRPVAGLQQVVVDAARPRAVGG